MQQAQPLLVCWQPVGVVAVEEEVGAVAPSGWTPTQTANFGAGVQRLLGRLGA